MTYDAGRLTVLEFPFSFIFFAFLLFFLPFLFFSGGLFLLLFTVLVGVLNARCLVSSRDRNALRERIRE